MKNVLTILLLISVSTSFYAQETSSEDVSKSQKRNITFEYPFPENLKQTSDSEARLNQWYRDAKFGKFIHFGVYLEDKYKGRSLLQN